MIGTLYTHKLPRSVREGMQQVSKDDCYLIKRRINKGVTGTGKERNCHLNVQDLVDRIGGERVGGWLFNRSRDFYDRGIYLWIFHSIWQTPEGEYCDVTESLIYGSETIATFWLDSAKQADLEQGKSYNNIIVLEHERAIEEVAQKSGQRLQKGHAYWTENSLRHYLDVSEHNGVYRLLSDAYPKNRAALEEQYDCKITEKGALVPNNLTGMANVKIFFDFSLS